MKLFYRLALAILFTLFIACQQNISEHIHSFDESWSTDTNSHWHTATCKHKNEISDLANHTFSDWQIVCEPTEEQPGLKKAECTVCNFEISETIEKLPHEHIFSEELTADSEGHWFKAICKHNDVKQGFEVHSYDDYFSDGNATTEADGTKSRICKICNYIDTIIDEGTKICIHTFSEEWIFDSENHWHPALCSHNEEVSETAPHIYENQKCIICNKPEHDWISTPVLNSLTRTINWSYVCSTCDYVCPHENLRKVTVKKVLGNNSLIPASVPEGKGSLWFYIDEPATEYICKACGEVITGIYPSSSIIRCSHIDNNFARKANYFLPAECSKCGLICNHEITQNSICVICYTKCNHLQGFTLIEGNNKCKTCDFICSEHNFDSNYTCTICKYTCIHEHYIDSRCTLCQKECKHNQEFINKNNHNICSICGFECTDHLMISSGYCYICKLPCKHDWNTTTYKCNLCNKLCPHPETDDSLSCIQCTAHVHAYSDVLKYNTLHHWKTTICNHDNLINIETYSHDYGDSVITKEPTEDEIGFGTKKCKSCNYVNTYSIPKLPHTYNSYWSKDELYHWHNANCNHPDLFIDKEEHSFISDFCKVCNYTPHTILLSTKTYTYNTDRSTIKYLYICKDTDCNYKCPHTDTTTTRNQTRTMLAMNSQTPVQCPKGTYCSEPYIRTQCNICKQITYESYPAIPITCIHTAKETIVDGVRICSFCYLELPPK